MADKKKAKGRPFQKGQSGNPKGRPPMPPELREIKKLSPGYIKVLIAKLSRMTPDQMMEWMKGEGAERDKPNNLEVMLASIIHKAVVDGDHAKLNFLLDRTIGKVVEEKKVQIQPVKYITKVSEDGALLQEVVQEAIDE